MKFGYIFVIILSCTLFIPEKSTAMRYENFGTHSLDEGFNGILDNNSENNTSTLQMNYTKTIPAEEILSKVAGDEGINAIMEKNSKTDTTDMQRKGKNKTPKPIRNCLDLKKQGKSSGIYSITPCDNTPTKAINVYCDMDTDGGGWTLIQRRGNYLQNQDFYNIWYEYAIGFGDLNENFWLGNDNIHCLTKQSHNELRFDLEDWAGNKRYAKYGFFYIDDQTNFYKLGVQNYTGNAGDSFNYHNNRYFTTIDADHDGWSGNCATTYKGAWWHGACHHSNLNGIYNSTAFGIGLNWYHFKGHRYSLKNTEMKIRPKM